MEETGFRFKEFEVNHDRSSMKVGVDAVLVGAWTSSLGKRCLDVGTGCGVIALMLAQRNPELEITAIDIDHESIEEAKYNFSRSPWSERLVTEEKSFKNFTNDHKDCFDLIVSNPPFFNSGLKVLDNVRLKARHQDELSPFILLKESAPLLSEKGRLTFILPTEQFYSMLNMPHGDNLHLERVCHIRNNPSKSPKRTLAQFMKKTDNENKDREKINAYEETVLTMFEKDGTPTPEYRDLCKNFYLKF